jgi:putative N6-adenine-specific DNA methylase
MLCRHDARREILLDPMCGSGTIAIEAALMGRGEPLRPGAPALFPDTRPAVVGNELHTPTMAAARANVAAAGADRDVRILHGDFRALTPEKVARAAGEAGRAMTGGVILCNPPYGARLDREDPVPLYRDLGAFCRQFPGWRAAFLVANRDFEGAFGGRPRITKPLRNASQPAVFLLYDL